MKRLVLLVLIVLIALIAKAQQYDTVYSREGDEIVKKLVPKKELVISRIKLQEGIEVDFSDSESEKLEKGDMVEKEVSGMKIPVKLLPIVETTTPTTTSSYKRGDNGVVEKIGEKPVFSSPRKDYLLSIFWLYIPFILIFVVSYLSTKNKDKGRRGFIIFFIAITLAVIVAIAVGSLAGKFVGLLAGALTGGFTGVFAEGPVEAFPGGFTGTLAGGFTGALAGAFTGALAGGFAGGFADPIILWQYVLMYVGVCVLAFLFREAITRKRKIAEAT